MCESCRKGRPAFDAARAWAVFDGPLQNALHRLKYRKDVGLGQALAGPLIELLADQVWGVDLVVPIPLGRARLAERGYNQVSLLAVPLALAHRLAYRPGALTRVRETRSQVGLSSVERRANVKGAFRAADELVVGRKVLLVDDVMTTGATLEEAARALRRAGAQHVYALSLARAASGPLKARR